MNDHRPIGAVCVLRSDSPGTWNVSICTHVGPVCLETQQTWEKAVASGLGLRETWMKKGLEVPLHLPDDCPCYACAAPAPPAGVRHEHCK